MQISSTDPLAFVISHNLTRRHLTESQRAGAAGRLANMKRGNPEFSKGANLPEVSSADAAGIGRFFLGRFLGWYVRNKII